MKKQDIENQSRRRKYLQIDYYIKKIDIDNKK